MTTQPSRRYHLFELKNIPTPNFLITPLELKDYIDFEVKRVYFISQPQGEKLTGSHCHVDSETELFIAIQGTVTMVLDDGHGLEEVRLEGPKNAIYVPRMVWHHFKDLSDDAIILALTSTNYDPERKGYCEDYHQFQELLKKEQLA